MFGIIKKIINTIKRNSAEKKYGNMQFEKMSFGSYPQSNSKVAEPIEWLVLKKTNGKALLLSDKVLHITFFDRESSNYLKSDVRSWLNGNFYSAAFTETEKARMETVTEPNDKVTLLSLEAVTELLPAQSLRQRQVTNVVRGFKHGFNKKTGMGNWMLLTPSNKLKPSPAIQVVGPKGEIDPMPAASLLDYGVVPAIIIRI